MIKRMQVLSIKYILMFLACVFYTAKCNFHSCPSVGRLVGLVDVVCWSVCHNLPKRREDTLPCAYRMRALFSIIIHFI